MLNNLDTAPAGGELIQKAKRPRTQISAIRQLTRTQEPKLRASLLRTFKKSQARVNINRLLTIYRRDPFAIVQVIPWESIERDLRIVLERDLGNILTASGASAVGRIAPRLIPGFRITNPRATAWAKERSSTLITQITADSKKAVRNLISIGFDQGITPQSTAREIRDILLADTKATIGLTDRQARSVMNEHLRLLQSGVDEKIAAKRAQRFAQKALNRRALTIARTETINAASEGQLQSWDAANQQGFLKPNQKKEWLVTPDDRLDRKICLPMSGQKRLLGETFTTGDNREVMRPTAHVNCRCAMRLVNPAR